MCCLLLKSIRVRLIINCSDLTKWIMPWFKRSILHINLWAHIKKMIYFTSLHFLRHEQWRTDGTGSEKHHVFIDKASTSTPHRIDTLKVWADRLSWPRSSRNEGMERPEKGPNAQFMSRCFKLSGSALSTSYSLFFFTNSSDFGFYILLL